MELSDFLNNIKNKAQENLNNSSTVATDAARQAADRVKMTDPEQMGPSLPENTPEGDKFADTMAASVMGSVGPAKKPLDFNLIRRLMGKAAPEVQEAAKVFGDNEATSAARTIANNASLSADQGGLANLQSEAQAQQQLSRAVDMQARKASQTADAKNKALRILRGR